MADESEFDDFVVTRSPALSAHLLAQDEALGEVHSRVRTTSRWRAAAAVVGAAAAVLALVAGIAVLTGPAGQHKGMGPYLPTLTAKPEPAATTRKLVYADGVWPMQTLHVGDRNVDISDQLPEEDGGRAGERGMVYLDTTDDGVVFTTHDGRVWFTDGASTLAIGQLGVSTGIGSEGTVRTGSGGSLAAWYDDSRQAFVVYDTNLRTEVAHLLCVGCVGLPQTGSDLGVVGDHVYWFGETYWTGALPHRAAGPRTTMLLDTATNRFRPMSARAYLQDVASQPRGLVVGDSPTTGTPTSGIGQAFAAVGDRLTALDPGGSATEVFDAASREALDLRLPAGYETSGLVSFDWLDDDHLAMVSDDSGPTADILVCRISTGQCRLDVPGTPPRWVANLGFP